MWILHGLHFSMVCISQIKTWLGITSVIKTKLSLKITFKKYLQKKRGEDYIRIPFSYGASPGHLKM